MSKYAKSNFTVGGNVSSGEQYYLGYRFILDASDFNLRHFTCLFRAGDSDSDDFPFFPPLDSNPCARERSMRGRVEILLLDNTFELWILFPAQL